MEKFFYYVSMLGGILMITSLIPGPLWLLAPELEKNLKWFVRCFLVGFLLLAGGHFLPNVLNYVYKN